MILKNIFQKRDKCIYCNQKSLEPKKQPHYPIKLNKQQIMHKCTNCNKYQIKLR